jgi:hypothetical protein
MDYPSAPLPGADNYFYWEKVDFGLSSPRSSGRSNTRLETGCSEEISVEEDRVLVVRALD